MTFPTHLLDHPLASADAALFSHLEQEADDQHHSRPANTTGLVRRVLHKSLVNGHFSVSDIARLLYMHERTMHRYLEKEGTTFRRELESIRYELARQLLSNNKKSLSTIANALGYTEASTFIRSFRRWSGTTPAQWRSHHADL